MRTSVYIAKKIIFNKQPSFSGFIIKLATVATGISVATMVVTLSMVNGFQHEVSQKVFSFWGHVRVQSLEPMRTLMAEEAPLQQSPEIEKAIESNPAINHVHAYATRSLVLRSSQQFEGVLLKGVDRQFEKAPFSRFIKSGRNLSFADSGYSSDLLLSEQTAAMLQVKVGDTIRAMAMRQGEELKTRRLVVCGLFRSGIEEYDKNFAIADLGFLQKLNGWGSKQVGGYEVWLNDEIQSYQVARDLTRQLPQGIICQPIKAIYPNIFDWLNIQNQTKQIVIGVMLAVALINLVTCLLILVMERTKMVAILSAAGMTGSSLREIFWYYAAWIAGVGILAGLLLGLGVLGIQMATGIIRMDEATYYVDRMPVYIIWWQIAMIAAGCFVVCVAALRVPLAYIRRISIIKALRFS